jgi:hypothetical protein
MIPRMRLLFAGSQIGYTFASRILPARTLLRDRADRGYGFRWTLTCDGYLKLTDNQADTTAQMNNLEAVLRTATGDLKFQYDDNTDTPNAWLTADTFTGVRCTNLTWTNRNGAEFRTFRSFSCQFEWEEIFPLTAGYLLDFTETVRSSGGVPGYVTNEAVNGVPPQSAGTVLLTKWTATQSGRAVGLSTYPLPGIAPFVFGATSPPLKSQDFGRTTPERKGDVAKYRGYEVAWAYQYESATPLVGVPNLWAG